MEQGLELRKANRGSSEQKTNQPTIQTLGSEGSNDPGFLLSDLDQVFQYVRPLSVVARDYPKNNV
jgi:hypothetical protein